MKKFNILIFKLFYIEWRAFFAERPVLVPEKYVPPYLWWRYKLNAKFRRHDYESTDKDHSNCRESERFDESDLWREVTVWNIDRSRKSNVQMAKCKTRTLSRFNLGLLAWVQKTKLFQRKIRHLPITWRVILFM